MFVARTFAGKRIAVFGLARSGRACVEALQRGGAELSAWDDGAQTVADARAEGLPVHDLNEIDFASLHALVLSPGVPLTHPEPHWTVRRARRAGVEVIGDTEVFQREIAGSGAELVAITGTNGKSTTTALTGHLFQAAGRRVEIGGNIGKAVLTLAPPEPGLVYVIEFSSFQIDLTPSLAPKAGILTNISPDHLDRHGSMENYAAVKARIFARQRPGDCALIGVDDPWGRAIAARLEGGREVLPVSVERSLADGISAPDGVLRHKRGDSLLDEIDLRSMPSLKGAHNWQNACMAYGAGRALGLTSAEIAAGFASFPGLVHRMQEVGRLGTISFVNDSKATNADAASKALASFENVYWIAGGIPKAGGIGGLEAYFPRIRKAYLIGQAAEAFARTLEGKVAYEHCGTLDRAVMAAAGDAQNDAGQGVVLLSPACASFDHYPNFEVRGEAFVRAVASLPGIAMKGGRN